MSARDASQQGEEAARARMITGPCRWCVSTRRGRLHDGEGGGLSRRSACACVVRLLFVTVTVCVWSCTELLSGEGVCAGAAPRSTHWRDCVPRARERVRDAGRAEAGTPRGAVPARPGARARQPHRVHVIE